MVQAGVKDTVVCLFGTAVDLLVTESQGVLHSSGQHGSEDQMVQ